MHTNDVLTGRCLCACEEIETVFISQPVTQITRRYQARQPKGTCACERVTFSDVSEVVVQWSICMLMAADMKMSIFWTIFGIENCISRSFSATTGQTRPLNACHNITQQALSTHLYSVVSPPSIPDLNKKCKNRLISPGHGETRLNSCVCEVHEGRYSTDNNSAQRVCFLKSIELARDP